MPTPNKETEDLLNEYLRVINNKDTEINRLLAEKERVETDLKKAQDRYRAKIKQLKADNDEIKGRSAECDRLIEENQALESDVSVLRDALQKQDAEFQKVLKTNNKAQKSEMSLRERLDQDFKAQRRLVEDRAESAEEKSRQSDARAEQLQSRMLDAEREASRLKVEIQRMQSEASEASAITKDLKRRIKELVPKESVAQELTSVEQRHRSIVEGLDKEVQRLRRDLQEEAQRAGRAESQALEYRRKLNDVEADLANSERRFQETDINLAQEKLSHHTVIEEIKQDYSRDVHLLKDQIDRLAAEKSQLQAESTTMQRDLHEAQSHLALMTERYEREEKDLGKEIVDLKERNRTLFSDLDGLKRTAQQSDDVIVALRAKNETLHDEQMQMSAQKQLDVDSARDQQERLQGEVEHREKLLKELRGGLSKLQGELKEERGNTTSKDETWRAKMADFESVSKKRDEEMGRMLLALQDRVREMEADHHSTKLQWERDKHAMVLQHKETLSQEKQRVADSEGKLAELNAENKSLQQSVSARTQREQNLVESQRETDEKKLQLELQMTEKNAAIATMQRSLESHNNALGTSQQREEQLKGQLDDAQHNIMELQASITSLKTNLHAKDSAIAELSDSNRSVEAAAQRHEDELQEQLDNMKNKVHQLVQELHNTEQQVAVGRIDLQRLEARHAEECSSLQHDVLMPLQEKVEALVTMNNRLHSDVAERDNRLAAMAQLQGKLHTHEDAAFKAQSEASLKDRRIATLDDEVRRLREQAEELRGVQRDKARLEEEQRGQKSELDDAKRRVETLRQAEAARAADLTAARDKEGSASAELSSARSELSLLKDRVSNLESLKSSAEREMKDGKTRERELQARYDDLQHSHQTLQLCFNKQQDQIENSKKLLQHEKTAENRRRRADTSQLKSGEY